MNAMNTVIKGNVHLFGANIDTAAIIPARYANLNVPADLGRHCMEGTDPGFAGRVSAGDIIVAGSSFGCGSSREVAPFPSRAPASPASWPRPLRVFSSAMPSTSPCRCSNARTPWKAAGRKTNWRSI